MGHRRESQGSVPPSPKVSHQLWLQQNVLWMSLEHLMTEHLMAGSWTCDYILAEHIQATNPNNVEKEKNK
jgi:hypothetical protein